MQDDITRSPLCWPNWFPRTPASSRTYGRFGQKRASGYGVQDITLAQARSRVIESIGKFTKPGRGWRADPDDVIISTDLATRRDGLPRSGQRKPDDPGVAVYFELDGEHRCIPCDSYTRIEDNLAAVAATIEALRTIERHGSQMFRAAFTGFTGLPSPDQVQGRTWRDVISYYGSDMKEAKRAYRMASSKAHPDNGGSTDAFYEVQVAWDQAKQEMSNQNRQ